VRSLLDALLVLAVLFDFLLLGIGDLGASIRISAMQAATLAALPLLAREDGSLGHPILLFLGVLAVKVVLIPRLLFRAIRDASIRREMEPLIGYGLSLVLGGGLVLVSFALAARLPFPGPPPSDLLVPAAFSTVLIGLLLLVGRAKALAQVIGWLVVENGIFLFGLAFVHRTPMLVEMGILLDVFAAVFVMGIMLHHIHREFDRLDTRNLTALRDR
jgi:hydrogenase-4 component E